MLKWLWLAAVIVFLDQLAKFLAVHYLQMHEPLALLPGLNLTLTHNTGAAFSILSKAGGWQRWFFTGLTMVIAVVIVIWLTRLKPGLRWLAAALSLILGGALGNLYDRVVYGQVVDFIDVHAAGWHWPAFNLADSAITVGAGLLILESFLHREGREGAARDKAA